MREGFGKRGRGVGAGLLYFDEQPLAMRHTGENFIKRRNFFAVPSGTFPTPGVQRHCFPQLRERLIGDLAPHQTGGPARVVIVNDDQPSVFGQTDIHLDRIRAPCRQASRTAASVFSAHQNDAPR